MTRCVVRQLNLFALITCALVGPMLEIANAAEVALYRDGAYVDADQEATNVANTLTANGDTVIDITGTSGAFVGPLTTADILVIPELEKGDLNAALDATSRNNIRAFVDSGGIMVVHGGSPAAVTNAINIMNGIFGVSFSANEADCTGTTFSPMTSEGESQGFAGGPSPLNNISCTTKVTKASIASAGGTTIYESNADDAVFFPWARDRGVYSSLDGTGIMHHLRAMLMVTGRRSMVSFLPIQTQSPAAAYLHRQPQSPHYPSMPYSALAHCSASTGCAN